MNKYKDYEPCNHPGCMSHLTHPCEGCGRIGGINPNHKCLSCPTLISSGDYCSECSDTPDGRLKHEINIETRYNKDEIQLITKGSKFGLYANVNSLIEDKAIEIIKLKEESVRKALIDLGWTPPPEKVECKTCSDTGEVKKEYQTIVENNKNCSPKYVPHNYLKTVPCPDCNTKKDPYGVNTPRGKQSLDSEQRFFEPK